MLKYILIFLFAFHAPSSFADTTKETYRQLSIFNEVYNRVKNQYVEELTDKIEMQANKYFDEIKEMGGTVQAIEEGYFQKKIAESASIYQESVDSKERVIVGVNDFVEENEKLDIEILKISKDAQETQEKKIKKLRETRDSKLLEEKMKKLSDACKKDLNLVPYLVEVAEAGGTVGEIVEVMKEVYGEWEESFGI